MRINRMKPVLPRSSAVLVALFLWVSVATVTAQGPCDLYVQIDENLSSGAATLDVAVQGTCQKPQTGAYARVTLPDNTYKDAYGSGASYAEALASAAINNQAGQASFSGQGDASDQCWENSYNYYSFSDPFTINNNTPNITGIDPGNWLAGQTTRVTFSGYYFGTNAPTLSFSPSSGLTYSLVTYNDNQIVADVTVASGTPDEDVSVTVTNNGYGGQGFQSGGGAVSPNSPPASARVVTVYVNQPQVIVIGWINGQASDLATLPSGANSTLISNLSSGGSCTIDVVTWAFLSIPKNISTQNDRDYTNAYMLKHSANPTPPNTIDSNYASDKSKYRLFNNFGGDAWHWQAEVGITNDPCGWIPNAAVPGWVVNGQPSVWNGHWSTSPSGKLFRVNEGRIGSTGQASSETINQGRTVPWVYSVIAIDSNGNVTIPARTSFPTFYVYINGVLQSNLTSNQSSVHAFVYGYDELNQQSWYPVP